MATQLIYEPTDYFSPFPEPRDVFGDEWEAHCKYLLPLASVTLSHLNPEWEGRVHFVLPIEPHEGLLGEHTERHHTYLCRTNWIGYRIDARHHFQLAADFCYFQLAEEEANGALAADEDLSSWYASVRESFKKRRQHFAKAGALHHVTARRRNGRYSASSRLAIVADLGGQPGAGNWAEHGSFPQRCHEFSDPICGTDVDCYPLAEDGSEFTFVGWLHGHAYVPAHGGCGVYLFYHHEQQLALTTFDWG